MDASTLQTHPTAIVSPDAILGEGVKIGPYAVIEDRVEIGAGTVIGPHVVIHSHTRIGARNQIYAHAVLGGAPQHLAYKPEDETWLDIGDDNVIREMVTMHRALYNNKSTLVGSHCFFMAGSHVAHDCCVGNYVVMTNNALLGGHVTVGERVVLGGASSVHQFARIGPYAMVAADTLVRKDVLPYSMIAGDPARHYRLNSVGLQRNGIQGERYKALERAYRALRNGKELDEVAETPEVELLQQWLAQSSNRGLSGFLHK